MSEETKEEFGSDWAAVTKPIHTKRAHAAEMKRLYPDPDKRAIEYQWEEIRKAWAADFAESMAYFESHDLPIPDQNPIQKRFSIYLDIEILKARSEVVPAELQKAYDDLEPDWEKQIRLRAEAELARAERVRLGMIAANPGAATVCKTAKEESATEQIKQKRIWIDEMDRAIATAEQRRQIGKQFSGDI